MSGAGISKHLKNAEIEQLLDDLASYARSDVEHLDFIQSDTDSEGESDDIYNLGSGNAVHVPVSVDDDYFVWEDMENFSNNTEEFMCDLGSLVNFNSIFRGMFGTANVADHLLIRCVKMPDRDSNPGPPDERPRRYHSRTTSFAFRYYVMV
ncbi:uncharacterized protein LOC142334490 isoform X3 [Lycorma delicatula]|uniref:uncharacterized protein LOC142334490 isoform X3 n=1 Tax=Lycorma delicatula TaxID=130591 RepID=UPI003F512551